MDNSLNVQKSNRNDSNKNHQDLTPAKVKDTPSLEHKQVKTVKTEGQPGSGLGGTSDDESMLQQLQKLNIRYTSGPLLL